MFHKVLGAKLKSQMVISFIDYMSLGRINAMVPQNNVESTLNSKAVYLTYISSSLINPFFSNMHV